MNRREYSQVLTFLEEAQKLGLDYAEHRLLQRLAMGLCQASELGIAADKIDQHIERKYSFFHWWYTAVIGLAAIALPLYLYAIAESRVPVRLRQIFCVIIPAIVIFIRLYTRYLRELNEKRRLHREEMSKLYNVLGISDTSIE